MIHIIAAIQKKDRGLGFQNQLLYHIPEDLKRFKKLTTGHPIIIGRKTFQSIGRALPNRTNIVVTRENNFSAENVLVVHSTEEALKKAQEIDEEIFVLGGGQIYNETISYADVLDLTLIEGDKEADVFFPEYEEAFKKITFKEEHSTEEIPYTFLRLEK